MDISRKEFDELKIKTELIQSTLAESLYRNGKCLEGRVTRAEFNKLVYKVARMKNGFDKVGELLENIIKNNDKLTELIETNRKNSVVREEKIAKSLETLIKLRQIL